MNTLLKISQQTIWQVLGKVISSISTIIILGLISRNFGESGTGVITLALTYLGFFALAADFGINAHVMPEFLKGDLTYEFRKLLGLRIVLALLFSIPAAFFVSFWPGQAEYFRQAVWLGLLVIIQTGVITTCLAVFQSRQRFDFAVISSTGGSIVTLGVVLILLGQNIQIPGLLGGYVAGWVTAGLLALLLVQRFSKSILPLFDFNYLLKVLKFSWPISLTLILNLVYFRLDAFLLSIFKSFHEVGIYNLSYQIFQSLLVLPTFIMSSYYPLMLKSYSEDKIRFFSKLKKACVGMFALAFLGTILTVIFAPWAVMVVTGGKGFAGSVQSLQILSLGFPAFFVSAVLMWALVTLKKYKTLLVIYLAGLLLNGVLNYLLIPHYSYLASAWITGFSEYLILLFQLVILVPALRKISK